MTLERISEILDLDSEERIKDFKAIIEVLKT
jgi:hypothetical protein